MSSEPNYRVIAGVDGIPGGWIAAMADASGATSLECFDSFGDVARRALDLVVIDIPIGLPDARSRRADLEARRLLGARRNSVFPAPSARCSRRPATTQLVHAPSLGMWCNGDRFTERSRSASR